MIRTQWRVGPAEGLHAREVLEQPVRLGAVERLVDPEEVRVAVEDGSGLPKLSSSSARFRDVVVISADGGRSGSAAWDETE